MNAAQSVTANFSAVVVNAPVASLTPPHSAFASTPGVASAAAGCDAFKHRQCDLSITGITIAGTIQLTSPSPRRQCVRRHSALPAPVARSTDLHASFGQPALPQPHGCRQRLRLATNDNARRNRYGSPTFAVSSTTTPQTFNPAALHTYSITAKPRKTGVPKLCNPGGQRASAGATATFSPPQYTGNSSALRR